MLSCAGFFDCNGSCICWLQFGYAMPQLVFLIPGEDIAAIKHENLSSNCCPQN
ncbi:hypothetical protein SLEP1_g411 [Rubroshorea leprosula]|uniref:Uncharacterized protein n=1 Tax=Rubroshorea leprosula TaxID=152421 RepID=A0AAV5HIQ0_9ROSI|nr:hypothetical protein SLEP1_g411 [Rubroshorea leprosula]